MKCKKIFALLLSLCVIATTFVALPVSAATENVIEINLPLDDASELTWVQSGVTVSNADGIGGRDDVVLASGLANSNDNTVGVKLPDGFAFAEGDTITYSIDVYSETAINPDMWLRNHGSSLNPLAIFYNSEITAETWTTVTKTVTFTELEALIAVANSSGTFATSDNYAFYLRPRASADVYLDNLVLTVTREVEDRGNIIEIEAPLDASSELTWIASEAVTVTEADAIGGRDDVLMVAGLADSNSNTAGLKLPDGFAFQSGDIITYSVDVYSDTAINPDIWLRNHGSALTPLTTFYNSVITAGTWTTLTKTVTFDELGTTYDWTTEGDYKIYIRPRTSATVYLDNFTVTVSRLDYTGEPLDPDHECSYGEWVSDGADTHTQECTCGKTVTEDHTWNDGVVTTEPTYVQTGVKTYTCTGCGETKTEAVDKLAYTENIVDITVDSASEITWIATDAVTASDVDGIGGRDGVIELAGLANSNNNTAGIIIGESFAFQEGDILTYSFDVYSDSVTNPDIWVRNHDSSLSPYTTFYHTSTTGEWTTITQTATYEEMEAKIAAGTGTGTFATTGYYALYIRPRQSGTVYVDNFTVTVSRETDYRGKIIDIDHALDTSYELTWIASDAVTVTEADVVGGRDNVLMVAGLDNTNSNTAGLKLPDGFAFQSGDIIKYSVDVYSDTAINPDIWLRNHGSALTPLTTFYNSVITAGTWTTLTKTVTFDELGTTYDWTTEGNYAIYIRPRSSATVYLDNFSIEVSRIDYEGDPLEEPHVHTYDDGVVTTEPTTETEGVMTYTCSGCGDTYTEVIEKLEETYTLGDPTGDGTIDVKDVIIIRQDLAGGYGVTMVTEAADVNVDGELDVKDVIMLRQYLAGGYGVEF